MRTNRGCVEISSMLLWSGTDKAQIIYMCSGDIYAALAVVTANP